MNASSLYGFTRCEPSASRRRRSPMMSVQQDLAYFLIFASRRTCGTRAYCRLYKKQSERVPGFHPRPHTCDMFWSHQLPGVPSSLGQYPLFVFNKHPLAKTLTGSFPYPLPPFRAAAVPSASTGGGVTRARTAAAGAPASTGGSAAVARTAAAVVT